MIGAIMRQGPHHVAQKSTTASPSCFSISVSKFESVTATAFDIVGLQHPRRRRLGNEFKFVRSPASWSASPMPSPDRRGTRIAHVGIAVRSIGDLLPFCRDILQLPEA